MRRNTQQKSKLTLAIAIFAMAFSLVGASCSKQDPLAGQPEEIRNGLPPEQKVDTEPAVKEDLLQIRAEDYISFKEDVEGKTKITGAMLYPVNGREPVLGQDFEIVITNIGDFGGATFDAMTGEFKWKPKKGFTAQNYTRQAHLDIAIATLDKPVVSRSLKVPLWVTRAKVVPEIVSIDFDPQTPADSSVPLREGEKAKFTVTVRDAAAIDKADMRPRLIVLPQSSTNNKSAILASAISQEFDDPTVDSSDPQLYKFKLVLDLSSVELTRTRDTFAFSVQAMNRYGEASSSKSKDVDVVTKLRTPLTTLGDAISVVRGQENAISFAAYDPYNESFLEVDWERCSLLGGEVSCLCVASRSQGATSTQNCVVNWKPALDQKLGVVDKQITIYQKTKVSGDVLAPQKTTAYIRMNVVAGPSETPKPAPISGGAQ